MEQELFKKLLDHEFYTANKSKLHREFFPGVIGSLFDTLVEAHEKYEEDVEVVWLKELHLDANPTLSAAVRGNISNLLDDISHADHVPDLVGSDLLESMAVKEVARQVANECVKVINGQADNLNDIKTSIEKIEFVHNTDEYSEVKFDMDAILSSTDASGLHPIRLDSLKTIFPGIGPGNLGIIFARPEMGKTTYACYEAAGYLKQGLRVLYCANEEPAKFPYLRIMCSYFAATAQELASEVLTYSPKFANIAKNLKMLDVAGMDIAGVYPIIEEFKPDIMILDQLDNFKMKGDFARDDLRLGALYQSAREAAKKYKVATWAVSQCSAEGENIERLSYDMLRGSKTDKAGAVDVVIGIGSKDYTYNNTRTFQLSKNKINGSHAWAAAVLNSERAIFSS
jgi:archaellum biogenesis ATPase FlaH|tara:strand:- start:172 stop:1365 length:1194 start_codon:yes stop_codon:yes gene_type:complete